MTPDSIDEELLNETKPTYAGFGQRLGAALLDGLIVSTPLSLMIMYGLLSQSFTLIGVAILVMAAYKVLMEGLFGATLGKMIVGIQVVGEGLGPVSLEQSVRKNMIYLIQHGLSWWSFGFIAKEVHKGDAAEDLFTVVEKLQTITDNPYDMASQFISFLIMVSCMSVLVDREKRQTIHDRLANTVCILKEKE